jgi:hypothetical protein
MLPVTTAIGCPCRDASAFAPIGYPTLRKLLKRWAAGQDLAATDLAKLEKQLGVEGKKYSSAMKEAYKGLLRFIQEYSTLRCVCIFALAGSTCNLVHGLYAECPTSGSAAHVACELASTHQVIVWVMPLRRPGAGNTWHASEDDAIKAFAAKALCIEYPAASIAKPAFVNSQQFQSICENGSWTWADKHAVYSQFPALHELICSKHLSAVPTSLGKFLMTLRKQCTPWEHKGQVRTQIPAHAISCARCRGQTPDCYMHVASCCVGRA